MTKNWLIHKGKTLFIIMLVSILGLSCAQEKPSTRQDAPIGNRKSPIAIASIKENNTYIKVVYGQPYRNSRTIFGEWEPYGQVWRTGANEATEITITEPVLMGDNVVEAGTYSLYSIPGEENWTIILNYALGEWGAFDYSEERDALRFEVPVKKLDTPVEAFTIEFSKTNLSLTTMSLSWDLVQVDIPIRFY